MPDPLQQICVSLPPNLIALVQRHASGSDRTIGGTIRHIVAEWARGQPPPEGVLTFPTLPGVPGTVEGIAEAKGRITAMRQEQDRIRRKKSVYGTTVDEDTRHDRLNVEIGITNVRIAMAERLVKPNGG
jgi:hypothetical protein